MAGKHKKGSPSYAKWIESYRKKKPIKSASANVEDRKPHKPVPKDADEEKAVSFASMAPTVRTREAKMRMQETLRPGSTTDRDTTQYRHGYGGMGGQGFGKSALPTSEPSQDDVRAQTLGMSPAGNNEPNPEFIDNKDNTEKSVDADDSQSSTEFANTQEEMKKFLGDVPSVTVEQGKKRKGPAYHFEEDGALDAPVQKSYNMERVRLAWDLYQVSKKRPHYNLKKSDPVKGTVEVNGVELCIEWPKGSIRRYKEDGIMKDGKLMQASYGYVPDTITADGEELDVYVGPNRRSEKVFLILQKPTPWDVEQNNLEPEEKYMLGFDDMEEARHAFIGSMPSRFFKNIRQVGWDYFIKRVEKARKKLAKHTEAESCGYLYKETLDKYDRSQTADKVVNRQNVAAATSVDADLLNLVKNLDGLAKRIKSIPRLIIPL